MRYLTIGCHDFLSQCLQLIQRYVRLHQQNKAYCPHSVGTEYVRTRTRGNDRGSMDLGKLGNCLGQRCKRLPSLD